jgi:hypothetical protein
MRATGKARSERRLDKSLAGCAHRALTPGWRVTVPGRATGERYGPATFGNGLRGGLELDAAKF